MDFIKELLTGPYGSLIVGVIVLLIEYLAVKPLLERRRKQSDEIPLINQKNKKGNNVVKISRNQKLVIKQVTSAPVPNRGGSSEAEDTSDDNAWGVVLLGLVVMLFLAWVLARFPTLVGNIMIGTALGSLVNALFIAQRFRRSIVPRFRWVFTSLVVSGATLFGVHYLTTGSFKGVDFAAFSSTVRELGFFDAIQQLTKMYHFEVIAYFAFQMLGAALLILSCVTIFLRLIGVGMAAAAIESPSIRTGAVRVIQFLYPPGSPIGQIIALVVLTILGLLAISGWYWTEFSNIGNSVPLPGATTQ